jgi:hypothetical protein
MRNRREFLRSLGLGLGVAPAVLADVCGVLPNGLQTCRVEIDFEKFLTTSYEIQKRDEWCWAACISMIFAYHGHPVSQERIVTTVYGSPVDMPAQHGIVIARQLNRPWKDDDGNDFTATVTHALDMEMGVDTLDNSVLANELRRDRPIILGTITHAVVMTEFTYTTNFTAVDVGVFDPWPGRGARSLTTQEARVAAPGYGLFFVATVDVED